MSFLKSRVISSAASGRIIDLGALKASIAIFLVACVAAIVSTVITSLFALDEVAHAHLTLACLPVVLIILHPSGPILGKRVRADSPSVSAHVLSIRDRGWVLVGCVVPISIAISLASMHASPGRDLYGAGEALIGLGCMVVIWWLIAGIPSRERRIAGFTLLFGAVATHFIAFGSFDRQVEAAEAKLQGVAFSRLRDALSLGSRLESDKQTLISGDSVRSLEVSNGTLTLVPGGGGANYEMVWLRKSILTAFFRATHPVAVSRCWAGHAEAVYPGGVDLRSVPQSSGNGGEIVRLSTAEDGQLNLPLGSAIIACNSIEPKLMLLGRAQSTSSSSGFGAHDGFSLVPVASAVVLK